MPARHEVPRARHPGRLDQKLAVRANRLKAVMLYDDWFAREKPERKRGQSGTCNVNDVGSANQIPQFIERWPANHSKWKRAIVKALRGRLRGEDEFELRLAAGIAKDRQATRQRQNKCFNAANTRRKEMRVDQQFHSRSFCGAAGEAFLPEGSASATPGRRPLRATAVSIASNVAAIFLSGDQVCM